MENYASISHWGMFPMQVKHVAITHYIPNQGLVAFTPGWAVALGLHQLEEKN